MDIVDIQNEHIDISPFRYLYKSMDIHTRVTLPDVLRDVSNPGLLELAVCLGPQVLFQHFVLKGSQSPREDCRRINTQIMIKTGLPKEQYITYHVQKNASAALTFNTIYKSSLIADSMFINCRFYCGTNRFNRSVAPADSAPGSANGSPMYFVNSWALGWSCNM